MKSEFSVGLADKVCDTWDKEGGTPAELNSFAENNALVRGLLAILRVWVVVKPLAVDASAKPHVIQINRSKPFNPAEFIGAGWSVWRGPANGNGLEGEEERDPRSAMLTELDIGQVQLVTCLKQNEKVLIGRALKSVLFPTFGSPTMPIFNISNYGSKKIGKTKHI